MSSNCLTVDTLRFDRFINISYSRALNRRDSLLINIPFFATPPNLIQHSLFLSFGEFCQSFILFQSLHLLIHVHS